MKAVVQRVEHAEVRVDGDAVSTIGRGLVVLLGVEQDDSAQDITKLAESLPRRRFFEDTAGKMNLSLLDIKGEVLVVSQFTLAADLGKGLRPSFTKAMEPGKAKEFVRLFSETLRIEGVETREGVFGAHMKVELVNDGPVTFIFEGE